MKRATLLAIAACVAFATALMLRQALQSTTASTATNDRFTGGSGDGYSCGAFGRLEAATAPVSPRYGGGPQDGYALCVPGGIQADSPPPAPRFAGGPFDGSTFMAAQEFQRTVKTTEPRFAGGGSDGYDCGMLIQLTGLSSLALHRFGGGAFGGYDMAAFLGVVGPAPLTSPRFFGGGADGYDRATVCVPMPLVLIDSNGNGIPDWWENMWYGAVTNPSPSLDTDGDGAPDVSEYIAGTDPSSSNSVFRIAGFVVGATNWEIACPTLDSRVYTVQACAELGSTTWTNLDGHVRFQGDIVGTTIRRVPASASNGAIRVMVDFP